MGVRSAELVQIRLKVSIAGDFHGVTDPQRGDVVTVESNHAAKYYKNGYAQPASDKAELGRPYEPYRGAA
jgi:hypothetical protein